MGLGSICYHTENKTCYIPEVCKLSVEKNIYMPAGFKVSSLACESVFCRPEDNAKGDLMELNFQGPEMQKWNVQTDRDERVDEKMGSFVKLSCFLSELVIKMSKMVHVLYFLLMTAKNQSQFKFKYMHLKDLN